MSVADGLVQATVCHFLIGKVAPMQGETMRPIENNNDQLPRYMSIKAAADFAGVAVNTMRNWVYRDGLPAARHGKIVRIETTELIKWLEPNITPAKAVA